MDYKRPGVGLQIYREALHEIFKPSSGRLYSICAQKRIQSLNNKQKIKTILQVAHMVVQVFIVPLNTVSLSFKNPLLLQKVIIII